MLEIYITPKKENEDKSQVAEALLQRILKKKGYTQKPVIKKNDYGKPFLDNMKGFHFNISHSGDYVGIAVSDQVVGFDLQKKETQKDVMAIAKRWFNKEEVKELKKTSMYHRHEHFYDIWTKKESYMKYTGLGFALPMKYFRIGKNDGRCTVFQDGNPLSQIELTGLSWQQDYRMAICSERDLKPEVIPMY
ncbi:MAG: 4'-phosphopantetheinyl transferase superfamily protein [Eubacteriaceae bacterium]|jgi:4'-phosphopantetheinyl transferase|nr:4'-phosphopantetheinyl transferase superfamily protein [Eubacteriaceae bacterium]